MANFETQIEQSKREVAKAQAKMSELSTRIETARTKLDKGQDITIDIENASLDEVHAHSALMNANIAEMILGLDDVTAGFSKEFDAMRSKPAGKKSSVFFQSDAPKPCAKSAFAPPLLRASFKI